MILLAIPSFMNGQEIDRKIVVITKEMKTVPAGKKWVLKSNTKVKIQVSDGSLQSGTVCNASFLSNPHMAGSIYKGDYRNSMGYGFFFTKIEKAPFTNDNIYSLYPISFFDKSFTLSQLNYMKPENIGISILQFSAGETVFVGNCIEAIELIEEDATQKYYNNVSNYPAINWDIKVILKMKTPFDLIKAFGKENIEADNKDGNIDSNTFTVFKNDKNSLQVIFGKEGVTYVSCRKKGGNWKFPFGLAIGESLPEVIKINNKDFLIYGFEWDYAGMLSSWNNGRLQNSGISISISTTDKSNEKLYNELLKEQQRIIKQQHSQGKADAGAHTVFFRTDNLLLRKVGFVVEEINIRNRSVAE